MATHRAVLRRSLDRHEVHPVGARDADRGALLVDFTIACMRRRCCWPLAAPRGYRSTSRGRPGRRGDWSTALVDAIDIGPQLIFRPSLLAMTRPRHDFTARRLHHALTLTIAALAFTPACDDPDPGRRRGRARRARPGRRGRRGGLSRARTGTKDIRTGPAPKAANPIGSLYILMERLRTVNPARRACWRRSSRSPPARRRGDPLRSLTEVEDAWADQSWRMRK